LVVRTTFIKAMKKGSNRRDGKNAGRFKRGEYVVTGEKKARGGAIIGIGGKSETMPHK